jgi:hypothetical protein
MSWLVEPGPLERAVHLFLVTWRFWWLRGHAAELVGLAGQMVTGSADLPPLEHALALTGVGFVRLANGDEARGRQGFEQSLPLYRQVSGTLGIHTHASVLAVLGHLAAIRRDYASACQLLNQGRARLQEVQDDGLTGYDRLQYLLTTSFVDNFLGQVRLGSTTTTARPGFSPTAWPKGVAHRTRSPCSSPSTTWRWPDGPRAIRPARRGT